MKTLVHKISGQIISSWKNKNKQLIFSQKMPGIKKSVTRKCCKLKYDCNFVML